MLAEEIYDTVQDSAVGQRRAALIAIEDYDGHAPHALARDAPVGPLRNHVVDAVFAPCRKPLHISNRLQGVRTQVVPIHADEPLLRRTEDGRFVAAPAVRIAVV